MSVPHAPVLTQVLNEATDIARATEQPLTSGHVLLAFFTVHNSAERLLKERKIDEDKLLDLVQGKLVEPADSLQALLQRAEQIAGGCGAAQVDCLHVLYAMTRDRATAAHGLLGKTGENIGALRQRALGLVTGATPVWVGEESRRPRRARRSELPRPGMSAAVQWSPPKVEPVRRSSSQPRGEGRRRGRGERPDRTVQPAPIESRSPELPITPAPALVPATAVPPGPLPSIPLSLGPSSSKPPAGKRPAPGSLDDMAAPWRLDPREYPWLTSLGRNLSVAAAEETLDDVGGRDAELETIVDVLGKRRANNPCLLGEPGVGKTAVVEALALRLVDAPPNPRLGDRIIIEIDVGSLLIGTHLRGSFSEKLQGLKDEVKRAQRVIVFFDELHTLVGAGATGDGAQDAANELKAALARGEFPCIGATTLDEWKKHVEPDPALVRRFQPVMVKEPSPDQAAEMILQVIDGYAEHHRVRYSGDAVRAACQWSARYITDRHLPDKAVALLDLAGSRAARSGEHHVTREAIAKLIAERVDIPVERILSSDKRRLLNLERHLARELVGHQRVLQRIADVVRRNAAGFGSHRPQGSFLFLGPTGVGKTETAKVLARCLHGSDEALLRFDLSEFSESHSVARLVGAPPGYVGHDAGGQLTEEIRRRPARVLLFDEIEKAHRDVLQVFLQILDDGRLTDSHGRTVGFAETIVIMTSNLGSDLVRVARPIGFGGDAPAVPPGAELEATVLTEAQRELAPELWARFDERLVFAPLDVEEVREVTRRLARGSSGRLQKERGIEYELDDRAVDYLVQQGGWDARLGARPMRQILSRIVEAPIAARILEGRLHADERVTVTTTEEGRLKFLVGEDRTSLSQRPMR